ncbi:hypothetical protein PanWU01x14_251990, partial [Parasponia andersonii]
PSNFSSSHVGGLERGREEEELSAVTRCGLQLDAPTSERQRPPRSSACHSHHASSSNSRHLILRSQCQHLGFSALALPSDIHLIHH